MPSKRRGRREARWQELRERANDAAGVLYVATTRFTTAQHSGTARDIETTVKALELSEQRYARARALLASFVAKSVKL